MRWLLLLTLVTALLVTNSASPVLQRREELSLRTRTSAIGGHLRLPSTVAADGDTMLLSGAGDGNEQPVSNNNTDDDDDEDRKTLSQQIADGKYGLLQNEIYTTAPERPGVISYDPNPEVPRDTAKNLGGLEQDEIWLAEDHVLVLRGGRYPDHKPNRTKPGAIWPPIDNYKAPPRQVKIPSNPKVPPPFPVQLTDVGPTELLGANGSRPIIIPPGNGSYFAPPFPFPPPPPGNFTTEDGPIYPPPPYFGYPPPGSLPSPSPPFQPPTNQSVYGQPPYPIPPSGNFTPGNGPPPFYPFPFPPPIRNGSIYPPTPGFFPPPPRNGSLFPPPGFLPPPSFANGSLPPGFFPPPPGYFPPGAAFLPPPGSLNDTFDEDDPSIYYPPPYDFFYPRDNTTQVPPGPLVPGIILPPPPNFFAPLNVSSTTIRTTSTTSTTIAPSTTTTERPATSIPLPPTSYLPRKKKPFRPQSPPPRDDTVAFNQVTTEVPIRYYSKAVNGIVISTPSPVTYVVVPVTDINISPQSPNKHSPFIVYKTSTQSPPTSNRTPQYQGRGGISTTISPPLQYQRAPKTSYFFYEEPQVAQGHLSEAGVLKSQQGYYRNGYYYEPPTEVSTPSPKLYYSLPLKSTTSAPKVYYIPSRSSTPAPQGYYNVPTKHSSPNPPVYYSAPKYQSPAPNAYYDNIPTPAPPVYYYLNARTQNQYYSTPSPQYQDIHQFKSNLQYYNSQNSPFVSSRPVYQFSYDAQGQSITTSRTLSSVALQFASTPRPASTPRTVYEYSFEKQPSNEIGGSYTTALPPIPNQFDGPTTTRPQYSPNSQFVQSTVSPAYAVATNSPGPIERPQYVRPSEGALHVRPTIRTSAQYVASTPNPQHAYYTPQEERLLDDITKKYFTIFGQRLGGGGTTPMTPTRESYLSSTTSKPTSISLEGDISVNYRPPLPAIEPESEFIDPAGVPRLRDGELISYRLPGNDAHFYFLTPQARQRYRRRKTPR